MVHLYRNLFDQYIGQLYAEIEQFPEDKLWKPEGKVTNSAGTLGLHLCGNLQFFVGATLGGNGYVRNRDEEFSAKIPKADLLKLIRHTQAVVSDVFSKMHESELETYRKFELRSLSEPATTAYFLSHLAAHLGYHIGQLNYYRRLLF